MRRALGFTLWELLCTLGIAAIDADGRRPGLPLVSARRSADGRRQRLGARRPARAQRGREARPARHRLQDRRHARGAARARRGGWMVYVNLDGHYPPRRSAVEPLLFVHTSEIAGTVISNRPYYEFRPRAAQHERHHRILRLARRRGRGTAVIVSHTGRPRVDARRRRPAAPVRRVDISTAGTAAVVRPGRRSSGRSARAAPDSYSSRP